MFIGSIEVPAPIAIFFAITLTTGSMVAFPIGVSAIIDWVGETRQRRSRRYCVNASVIRGGWRGIEVRFPEIGSAKTMDQYVAQWAETHEHKKGLGYLHREFALEVTNIAKRCYLQGCPIAYSETDKIFVWNDPVWVHAERIYGTLRETLERSGDGILRSIDNR